MKKNILRFLLLVFGMKKSKATALQFRSTQPNNKNIYIHMSEYFYDINPGEFCVTLYLDDNIDSGKYTLWVMDARTGDAKQNIEFKNR